MKRIIIGFIAISFAMVLFSGCKKTVSIDCNTKLKDVNVQNKNEGATFLVKCPANCTSDIAWGTDIYTTDSSVCKAAIHAGVITIDKGGVVSVTIVKGLEKYTGSDRNGVKTSDWKTSWGKTAFFVSKK